MERPIGIEPTPDLGKSEANGKSGTYEALSGALGSV